MAILYNVAIECDGFLLILQGLAIPDDHLPLLVAIVPPAAHTVPILSNICR